MTLETGWAGPTPIPREPEELAPEEAPVLEITGLGVPELPGEPPLPVGPIDCTLPTTLMPLPDEPVLETTGVGWETTGVGCVATVVGPVTVPEPPTTVVTVPTGLLEPALALPEPLLATGVGVAGAGVVGVGGVGVVGVVVPEVGLVVPLPDVGLEVWPLDFGLPATGREIEALPEPWCETRGAVPARRARTVVRGDAPVDA
jgi:hypothetical protein